MALPHEKAYVAATDQFDSAEPAPGRVMVFDDARGRAVWASAATTAKPLLAEWRTLVSMQYSEA